MTPGGAVGIGPLSTAGQPCWETNATRLSPIAVTTPSSANETLRIRKRPSPARLDPASIRDNVCPSLESTFTSIDRDDGE
jgi:hypothetical protein